LDQNKATLSELMAKAQQGDGVAYKDLLGQCRLMLFALLCSRLHNDAQVEDLIQEILISLHKARHTYQPGRPFQPWLFGIANFRLKDHFRKHYKRLDLEQAFATSIEEEKHNFDVTFWASKSEELAEALDGLPPKQRQLVQLMKIEGYTAVEVAGQTGMTPTAVKVSVHRSVKQIKQTFKGTGENH